MQRVWRNSSVLFRVERGIDEEFRCELAIAGASATGPRQPVVRHQIEQVTTRFALLEQHQTRHAENQQSEPVEAARLLGIGKTTFYRKLRALENAVA